MTEKIHFDLHFDHLDLRNISMSLTTLLASCQCWCQLSHMTKYVASHFDNLDLRNAMVPLKMLSTSHDAETNAVA